MDNTTAHRPNPHQPAGPIIQTLKINPNLNLAHRPKPLQQTLSQTSLRCLHCRCRLHRRHRSPSILLSTTAAATASNPNPQPLTTISKHPKQTAATQATLNAAIVASTHSQRNSRTTPPSIDSTTATRPITSTLIDSHQSPAKKHSKDQKPPRPPTAERNPPRIHQRSTAKHQRRKVNRNHRNVAHPPAKSHENHGLPPRR